MIHDNFLSKSSFVRPSERLAGGHDSRLTTKLIKKQLGWLIPNLVDLTKKTQEIWVISYLFIMRNVKIPLSSLETKRRKKFRQDKPTYVHTTLK